MNEQVLVIAAFIAIIGVFVLVIRAAINQRRQEVQRLQRLGFSEVKDPDQRLVERLAEVTKVGAKASSIGTIFRRTAGWYEIYTFLPRRQEGRDADFVVRVPGLTLPKIRIMRKVPLGGRLGLWVNGIAAKVAGMGLSPVEVSGHPELAEHFLFFSDNPSEAAELIASGWRDLLREAPVGFAVSGEGDVLAFAFNEQIERALGKKKGQPVVPTVAGMPGMEEQRFHETVRRVERFVEAARGR